MHDVAPAQGGEMENALVVRHERDRAGKLAAIDEWLHGPVDPVDFRPLGGFRRFLLRCASLKNHGHDSRD